VLLRQLCVLPESPWLLRSDRAGNLLVNDSYTEVETYCEAGPPTSPVITPYHFLAAAAAAAAAATFQWQSAKQQLLQMQVQLLSNLESSKG
jgi:hypothetical protein